MPNSYLQYNNQEIMYGGKYLTLPITSPTLTTTAISNITTSGLTTGGVITSNGHGTVSARGVCYSLSGSPTLSNSYTINGSGTGSFTSVITGLTSTTTYYIRSYATNQSGTSYGNQVSALTFSNVGDTYNSGKIAYIAQVGDTGYVVGECHGMYCASGDLYNGTYDFPWEERTRITDFTTGAVSTAYGTGNANTTLICVYHSYGTPAAAAEARINGGWDLPSKDELNILYTNRVAIGGFGNYYYYTSSEISDTNSWRQNFQDGTQSSVDKDTTCRIRQIKYF